jgi:DNA polymerase-3 subunit delta
MMEINYRTLKSYLIERKKKSKAEDFSPVFLIYGEGLICKAALESLLDALLPEAKTSLNYDMVDGSSGHIQEAVEKVNTYSLLPGKKVVVINDTNIFSSKQNEADFINKAKAAFDDDQMDKAAAYLVKFLGVSNLSFDDIAEENRAEVLKFDAGQPGDLEWIDQLLDFAVEKDLRIPSMESMDKLLQEAVQKGFPQNNHLLITTDMVDKRRKLYKAINKHGVIVDCSVPKGERRADRLERQAVIDERLGEMVAEFEVTIDEDAYQTMNEMIGFDLAGFANNLEKLVSYVGERKRVTAEDVRSVLQRTKKDPIFELTNAVADRDFEQSLFYLESFLADGVHPLQILAAITNQMRKMLLIRCFRESSHGRSWRPNSRFDVFRRKTMPAIQAYDGELQHELLNWEHRLAPTGGENGRDKEKKRPKKASKKTMDLAVARHPQNPYPVFQMLLKSDKFTTEELINGLDVLRRTDFRLKSSRQSPQLILEQALFHICRPEGQ